MNISFALLSLIISLYPQTYPNYHHIFTWLNWLDLIEKILTKDLICQKPKVQRVVVQIEFSMTKSTLKWQLILLLTLSIDKNVCKVIKKKKKNHIEFFFYKFSYGFLFRWNNFLFDSWAKISVVFVKFNCNLQ